MNSIFFALLVLLGVATASHAWSTDCGRSKYPDAGKMSFDEYIVGGRNARQGELPWQVSVRYYNSHFCGGIIMNDQWIITAAHCVKGDRPSTLRVVVGEHDRSRSSSASRVIHGVSGIFVHEQYDTAASYDADIALLKLSSRINFNDDVQPACPPQRNNLYVGDVSTVSGWGALRSGSNSLPSILQTVNVPVTSNQVCRNVMRNTITEGMVCAGNIPEYEFDSCQGDSGGPLVVKNANSRFEIVGVVSWGYGCASGTPGVYARVSHYLDWINQKVASN